MPVGTPLFLRLENIDAPSGRTGRLRPPLTMPRYHAGVVGPTNSMMRADATHPVADRPLLTRPARRFAAVPVSVLVATLVVSLGCSQILLLRFLGAAPPAVLLVLSIAFVALAAGLAKGARGSVPLARLAACWLVAAIVLLLGGEGQLFYANIDWQVRDAVLADMVRHPWPFAYHKPGTVEVLRAPVGMYLLPATVGHAFGTDAASVALLVQNSAIVGILLALGSTLFVTRRARLTALGVILVFSGMDTLGTALVSPADLWPLDRSIEGWARLQYSSTITLAFWVPHHAIGGWTGAVLFLCWRRRIVPLAAFLGAVPFCVLWSPLGVAGAIPFAMLAVAQAAASRSLRRRDLILPAVAVALALPTLAYLGADAGGVGARVVAIPPFAYALFLLVEVGAVLALAAWQGGTRGFGRATLAVVVACLALCPFVVVGESQDFTMRASIPALLVLAVIVADRIDAGPRSLGTAALMLVLAIGALTPLREVGRAIAYLPPPRVECDVAAAWRLSFANFGDRTYFARLDALPVVIRPTSPARVPPTATACYDRPWKVPR